MENINSIPIINRLRKSAIKNMGFPLLLLVLIPLPFVLRSHFYLGLITDMLIFGLLAMSVDILIGYTGMVPFGHAAYFGLGAYGLGLFYVYIYSSSLWLMLLVGIIVPAIISVPFGWLQVRLGGAAFALLSMAFSMVFYTVVWKWRGVTGGDDGLPLPLDQRPNISIGKWIVGNVGEFEVMYWLTLLVVFTCFFVMWKVIHSPFGSVLESIRENEERASFIGFNVRRYKLIAFIIASALAGAAGSLFALHRGHIVPELLHWSLSGESIIMVLLGGIGTLCGPFLGSIVFIFAKDLISTISEHWMVFIGLFVILIVYFMPGGLTGLFSLMIRKTKD
jgi:branched-chain amino acid transport system permease protein